MDFKKNDQAWLIPAAIIAGLALQPAVQFALNSYSNLAATSRVSGAQPAALPSGVHPVQTRLPAENRIVSSPEVTKVNLGAETFERLINAPSLKLHPSQWKGDTRKMEVQANGTIKWTTLQRDFLTRDTFSREPILVVFTWGECPTCTMMREHFVTNIDKYPFQVLFIPIGNLGDNPKLDRDLLQYLGLEAAPANVRQEALAGGRFASQVLSEQTGALLVPAFAWRVGDEVGCGNLKGPELDAIVAKMRAATNGRSGK